MRKDVVYHRMKKFHRSDVKKHKIIPAIGLEGVAFGTLDEIFQGASSQPVVYSSNIRHVLNLAKDEGREVDVMGGVCIFGYGRVCVTYDKKHRFDLWLLPKNIDPMGDWSLYEVFGQKGFPKKWKKEKFSIDLSAAGLEPTLGRVVKIFNILEAASQFSKSINFMLPTEEYLLVRESNARRIGLPEEDIRAMGAAHRDIAEKYARTILAIQQAYFPGIRVSVTASHEPEVRKGLARIVGDAVFREAVDSLGKFSYHRTAQESEQYAEEEKGYVSLFLSRDGQMLTGKDSQSRVILLNARDTDSFLLQAMYVFNQLGDCRAADRLAFIGVGGGPSITTRAGYHQVLFPTDPQDAVYDDYFGKAPEQVLSTSDPLEISIAKMHHPYSARSVNSPLFAYINALGRHIGVEDDFAPLLDRWKATGEHDPDEARTALTSMMIQLKEILPG